MSDASKTLMFWLLAGALLISPPAYAQNMGTQNMGAQNAAPAPARPPIVAPARPVVTPPRPPVVAPPRPPPPRVAPIVAPPRVAPIVAPPRVAPIVAPPRAAPIVAPPRAAPIVAPPRGPHAQRPPTARAAPAIIPLPAPPPPEPEPEPVVEPGKGSVTQMPIPRFAALKSDEVNLRTGPGQRYPVDWVYRRRDLPVQIEREFDVWRLIRDPEGIKGWVHQATLTGRRSFFVIGGERAIRRQAGEDAAVVAWLQPGVIGLLRRCEAQAAWCQVQARDHKGWLKRDDFWGLLPGEAVN